jgi:hypothetical protein
VEELESRLAPSASAVSANVAVTTDPGVQQMPSIAADPADPRHLVVAYMDYSLLKTGYAGIGVAVSHDGGATWQHTSVPLPAGFDQGAGAPVAHFDGQGHVFVSFMAATFLGDKPPIIDPPGGPLRAMGFRANNGIFVARSDDGGLTWDQPMAVVSHLYDGQHEVYFEIKPDLAIDTFPALPDGSPNPRYGSLYEVWSRYYATGQFPGEPHSIGGSDIMFAVSRDEGQTWQLQMQPQQGTGVPVSVITGAGGNTGTDQTEDGVGHQNFSHVTVGPEGDIYVSHFDGALFTVNHSADGGASFSLPNPTTSAGYAFGYPNTVGPNGTVANDNFRTQNQRAIAADPKRPGTVYAAEANIITDGAGNILDSGDIVFARSTDYGVTWTTTFEVGGQRAKVLNDDNGGRRTTGLPSDVVDGQAMPRLVTDAQGDVAVIWYDTRRDPGQQLLDVFGTVSTDGGRTFSPNFRITDQSFDPNAGTFTDATGGVDYYLGDALGLTIADGTAYASWTDARNRNQDIYFASYPINPVPPPLTDRFQPNNTPATATDLGRVVRKDLYKLAPTAAGVESWFRVQAVATGPLTVSAAPSDPLEGLRLELFDATGTTPLATGTAVLDAHGQVDGQILNFPGHSGQTYLVHVFAVVDTFLVRAPASYTLSLQSLTADLGTQVYGAEAGSLASGDQAYYALTAAASGSLEVTLTPGASTHGHLHLELFDPATLSALATGQGVGTAQSASLAVTQGQKVYLHVFGDAGAAGDFILQFTNLDQFATPDNKTLFFPTGGNPCQVLMADLNRDGKPDLVVDYGDQNIVRVLLGNGDGTFQAPREYDVGVFGAGNPSILFGLPDFKREMVIADFNGDGIPDIAVLNYQSNDISLLLGRGDGTFALQRRINAPARPFAIAAGDLTGNGIMDLVVVGSGAGPAQQGWVLLGRGDATFLPPVPFAIPYDPGFPTSTIKLADLNHDGKLDLVYEGFLTWVLLGNGDGTFQAATRLGAIGGQQGGVVVTDLNGDGNLDIVETDPNGNPGSVGYFAGNRDGTFQQSPYFPSGEWPVALGVADLGSQVTLPDGTTALGPPDSIPDVIVANNGPPEIVILPGLVDDKGQFAGFGGPFRLTAAQAPLDLQIADVNGDGVPDVVVAETGGVLIYYGKQPNIPPNTTPQTARGLGTVGDEIEPAQTIVPGHQASYFALAAPTNPGGGAGDVALDFSGGFQAQGGAGLGMELRDARGRLLASGERFIVGVPQGAALLLHVFGVSGGTGAYTLDISGLFPGDAVIAVSAARAERLSMRPTAPQVPAEGGGGAAAAAGATATGPGVVTAAAVGVSLSVTPTAPQVLAESGGGAAATGPGVVTAAAVGVSLSRHGSSAVAPPPIERVIEAVSDLVGRVFPGLGPAVGRWLRLLFSARGGRAAVDPPAAGMEAGGQRVAVEAAPRPPQDIVAPGPPPAAGGGWSWAALLGLAGGYLLNGGRAARDRRRRPGRAEAR